MSEVAPRAPRSDREPALNRRVIPAPAPMDDEEIDLREYLATIIDAKWLILGITAVCVVAGVAYAFLATPIYRADALIQVESTLGAMADLKELSSILGAETPAEGEIEIIRSRSVISAVFDDQKLDILAEPRTFPIIGGAIARSYTAVTQVADPLLGMRRFAWGGERIKVERFNVSKELENKRFKLRAGENGTYELIGPSGDSILKGEVGKRAGTYPEGATPQLDTPYAELFVSALFAAPGTEFRLMKLPRTKAMEDFQELLKVEEKGKDTGIIEMTLDLPDAKKSADVLNAVAERYVRQNVERKSEEAGKTLDFVTAQLPELKANLEAAEVKLNEYRAKKGSVDLTLESQAVINKELELKRQVTELELKRAELRERFTDNHPAIVAVRKQLDQLQLRQAELDKETKQLPEEQLSSVRLMRDVSVANELYLMLQNKAQELRVVKSGTIGNVRVLDLAVVPDEPVKPKKLVFGLGSLVFGLAMGVVAAFTRKALNPGISDPDALEETFGLPVYATVPHSEKQASFVKAFERNKKNGLKVLANVDPNDLAIESLRSLRTSLQFALADAPNNIILVAGPRPSIGKSFLSVNLAHVLADAGKRVLLVDGDMRKGHLQSYFGGERPSGLSELLTGAVADEAAIRTTASPNLFFLTTGTLPPNPSELLLGERFRAFLSRASQRFDLVLVDGPPVLAVTDAAIIGRSAGLTLCVLRAGLHPARELSLALSRFRQNGVNPRGFVFNDLSVRSSAYAYGKYGYHYQYAYNDRPSR